MAFPSAVATTRAGTSAVRRCIRAASPTGAGKRSRSGTIGDTLISVPVTGVLRRLLCVLALVAATGCSGSNEEALVTSAGTRPVQGSCPEPRTPQAQVPSPEPVPAGPLLPPSPDELGPDGDLLPGTPAFEQRERGRAEYEALKIRGAAEARALLPEADAYVRADLRTANLLEDAVLDQDSAAPIGDGLRTTGVVVVYQLADPRETFIADKDLDGPQPAREDGVVAVRTFGTTAVRVAVDFCYGGLRGVTALDSERFVTYDAKGRTLLDSADAN